MYLNVPALHLTLHEHNNFFIDLQHHSSTIAPMYAPGVDYRCCSSRCCRERLYPDVAVDKQHPRERRSYG
jgi:hypothetical protein